MPRTRSTRAATKRGQVTETTKVAILSNTKPANPPPAKNPRMKKNDQLKAEPILDDELNDEFELSEEEMDTDIKREIPMPEVKTETLEETQEKTRTPSPKAVVIDETKYAKISNHDKATDGKCGHCEGCVRSPCQECSACKRQLYGECIDLYCTNERSGITERVNLREMYLKTLKMQQDALPNRHFSDDDSTSDEDTGGEDNQEKEEPEEKEERQANDKNLEAHQKKHKNFNASVYGGSSRALKSRRCGECEGCTKDDCGTCTACLDKPRFGGKGTKKKACSARYCRLKTLYRA